MVRTPGYFVGHCSSLIYGTTSPQPSQCVYFLFYFYKFNLVGTHNSSRYKENVQSIIFLSRLTPQSVRNTTIFFQNYFIYLEVLYKMILLRMNGMMYKNSAYAFFACVSYDMMVYINHVSGMSHTVL